MLIGNFIDDEREIILKWLLNIVGVAEDEFPPRSHMNTGRNLWVTQEV
jgi:hypothetical protein